MARGDARGNVKGGCDGANVRIGLVVLDQPPSAPDVSGSDHRPDHLHNLGSVGRCRVFDSLFSGLFVPSRPPPPRPASYARAANGFTILVVRDHPRLSKTGVSSVPVCERIAGSFARRPFFSTAACLLSDERSMLTASSPPPPRRASRIRTVLPNMPAMSEEDFFITPDIEQPVGPVARKICRAYHRASRL